MQPKSKEYPFPLNSKLLSKALWLYRKDLSEHERKLKALCLRFETLTVTEQQIVFDKIRAQYNKAIILSQKRGKRLAATTLAVLKTIELDFRPYPAKYINSKNLGDAVTKRFQMVLSENVIRINLRSLDRTRGILYMVSGYGTLSRANYLFRDHLPPGKKPPTPAELKADYYDQLSRGVVVDPLPKPVRKSYPAHINRPSGLTYKPRRKKA